MALIPIAKEDRVQAGLIIVGFWVAFGFLLYGAGYLVGEAWSFLGLRGGGVTW